MGERGGITVELNERYSRYKYSDQQRKSAPPLRFYGATSQNPLAGAWEKKEGNHAIDEKAEGAGLTEGGQAHVAGQSKRREPRHA